MTAGVTIPTLAGAEPTVVVRLVRPPAGDEGDIVVTSGDPVGAQAARVLTELVTALAAEAGAGLGDALGDVLGLLGLDPASGVPALPLDDIIATGRAAVWQWLRGVFASTSAATAWIDRLADLLGVAVGGSGTAAAPWTLCFDTGPVHTCVEIATTLDAGALVVVPAIRVTAAAPASLGVPARAELVARAVRLRLSADPGAEVVPDLQATVTIGTIDGASTLVSTAVPAVGGNVTVGALRTGLAIDAAGPQFLLEAHRVAFPNVTPFPVLDLTDTDAVLDAGGAVLTGAVDGVLTALGDSPAARTLFVLVGLRLPPGTTAATWPHSVTLDELFADPLAAVVGFHREVLAAGRWDRLVDELGALVRDVGGGAGVVGTGTDAAPWTVAIAVGATGRAELQAWSTTGADGTRLHLGTRLTLPGTTLSTGAELALALAVELVSVCLAGPAGAPAGLDPRPVPSVALTVDVRGDFVVDVGPIGILADAARIGVRWDAVTGLEPHVAVDGGRLVLDGTTAPLPMPVWDADERRLRFVGDIPWDVLERLVAQLLESLANEAAQLLPSLLGWRSTGAGGVPAIPPPLGVPAVPAAMLGLGDLVRDPVRGAGAHARLAAHRAAGTGMGARPARLGHGLHPGTVGLARRHRHRVDD